MRVTPLVATVLVAMVAGCAWAPMRPIPQRRQFLDHPLGPDLYMPVPADNPLRPEVIELGRRLFFDPILSVDSSFACATCHRPDRGFSNGQPTSVGVFGRRGTRNVPAILNRGYGRAFFWDGRIETLEDQVLQPILAPDEMGLTLEQAVERIAAAPGYLARFRATFSRGVNVTDLSRALASYVRTIRAGDSPFDHFVAGDPSALSEPELHGLRLFQGKARCDHCHTGTNLTDEGFHNTGVFWGRQPYDAGRAVVTDMSEDTGKFKTPTLREIERTAPYMHDGSLATLEDVVEFYDRGGNDNPFRDRKLRPLSLTAKEKGALVAFLESLSGEIREGLE